jgi:hypothetical protein
MPRNEITVRLHKRILIVGLLVGLLVGVWQVSAQSTELAATLEVLSAGVSVKRVNTSDFLPVKVEAIVGVGDSIQTDDTGHARITFFADGTDTELLPNTEYIIKEFTSTGESFTLSVEVLVGQTIQRIGRILDPNSNYNLETPSMSLIARGTVFQIRVEDSGRAGMLVNEGDVEAGADESTASVPPDFGIRADTAGLGDVVYATTFDELDAALDGCGVNITTPDDVSINVRLAPNREAPRVGTIAAEEVTTLIGVTESSGWYRISFRDGFCWILSSTAQIENTCAGLRVFPDDQAPEDTSLYSSVGDPVELETPAL